MKQNDLEIVGYDTEYLDAIEGHVTDLVPTTAPTAYPARTQTGPTPLVLPAPQNGGNPHPLANVLRAVMAHQPTNSQQDAYAIKHMQAMSETSSPAERNRAKLVLMAGWVAIAGIIAVGLHNAGLIDSRMAWLSFVVAFAYGVYRANRDENAHSPAGVERHKTDVYGKIRITEIEAADRANARNHETFNRVVERVYGANNASHRNPPQR